MHKEETSWGKPALEVKGHFTWGFINKQEDEDSSDEEKSDDEGKAEEKEKKESEDKKDKKEEKTIGSKLTLKNVDLKIQDGEFVCIIGDVGSGKTSLLNAIIGDMVYVSDKDVAELGGFDAEKTSEELLKLQSSHL